MGSPLGPALVNIFVGFYEQKLFDQIDQFSSRVVLIRFWLFRFRQVFGYHPMFHTLTSVGRKSTFSVLKICFRYFLQF